MAAPYRNVRKEPLDLRSFRAAATGFLSGRQPSEEEDLEGGDGYTTMSDSEGASSYQDSFRSALPSFLGGGKAKPKAPPQASGFLGSAGQGLLRTLTPSFLRTDENEDFASTCCPNLGFKQRLFGCACCFLVGQIMQFFSFSAMTGVLIGHPGRFARLYSVGNIMMVAASFFLSGPKSQWRKIWSKDRAPTFLVFCSTMMLTLLEVYRSPHLGRALLILLLVVVQWMAQVWYVLSYVPYGHTIGKKFLRSLGLCCCA